MSKQWFRVTWICCFISVIAILYAYESHLKSVRYSSGFFAHFGYKNEQVVVMFSSQDLVDHFTETQGGIGFAAAAYEPDIKRRPIQGVLEWFVTESAFTSSLCIVPYNQRTLTAKQTSDSYGALLEYANKDPFMSKFRPGISPQSRFSFPLLGQSIIRLMVIAAVSLLPAFGMNRACQTGRSIRRVRKRNKGLCIFCGYPCTDLLSPKCPECGNNHGQFY